MTSPVYKVALARLLTGKTVRRAAVISGLVGTALVLINHGDLMLAGIWPPAWKVVLTYMTPYCVSTYSSVARGRDPGCYRGTA